jgi:hypothetical protein
LITPIDIHVPSWLLGYLATLDAIDPGLLRDVILGRRERLPFVAAATAVFHDDPQVKDDATLAHHIRKSSNRRLLEYCTLNDPPESFLSLVRKADQIAGSPRFYVELLKWLRAKPTKQKLKTLHHSKSFTLKTLAVLDHLDPVALHVNTLAFVPNVYNARILNAQINFIRASCPDVSDKEIGMQVRRLGLAYKRAWDKFKNDGGYFDKPGQLIAAFVSRVKFPSPPFEAQDNVILLDTPKKMMAGSLRYRNCLRDKVMDVARGERYYFVWQSPTQDVVVELRIEQPIGIRLNDLQASGNGPVSQVVRREVTKFLADQGIADLPSWEDFLLEDMDSYHGEEFLKNWQELCSDELPQLQQA